MRYRHAEREERRSHGTARSTRSGRSTHETGPKAACAPVRGRARRMRWRIPDRIRDSELPKREGALTRWPRRDPPARWGPRRCLAPGGGRTWRERVADDLPGRTGIPTCPEYERRLTGGESRVVGLQSWPTAASASARVSEIETRFSKPVKARSRLGKLSRRATIRMACSACCSACCAP